MNNGLWPGLTAGKVAYGLVCWWADPSVPLLSGDKLHISMNITFHSLTCSEVHVDAMDVAGDNQMRMEHSMLKQRLTPGTRNCEKKNVHPQ